MMATTRQSRPPLVRHPGRVAIVAIGLLAVANLAIILAINSDTGESDTEQLPNEVETVSPEPGSVAVPQDAVSVDLRDDLTGELWIDGQPIPDDQLEPIQQGILTFRPGEGQDLTRFGAGEHTVVARCWPATDQRPADPPACYSFRFQTKA
jgi:hypothetical protein